MRDVDLLTEKVVLAGGTLIAEERSEMALSHPATALVWLGCKPHERGRRLPADSVVMTGILTPILPVTRGSAHVATFSTLGSVEKNVV